MFPAPTWSGLGFILPPRWGGRLEPESLILFFRPVGADVTTYDLGLYSSALLGRMP